MHDNVDVFRARLFRLCRIIQIILKPIIKINGKREELIQTDAEANSGIQKDLIWAKTRGVNSDKQKDLILKQRKRLF